MKKAKIILTSLAILAVIGGALAFKASRVPANLYWVPPFPNSTTVTTLIVGGVPYTTIIPNCTLSNRVEVNGSPINTFKSSTEAGVQTLFQRAGQSPVAGTYVFCKATFTGTAQPN
jgi:hypothetical protein